MPVTLAASLARPRLRYGLAVPAGLVTAGLIALCWRWLPESAIGAAGGIDLDSLGSSRVASQPAESQWLTLATHPAIATRRRSEGLRACRSSTWSRSHRRWTDAYPYILPHATTTLWLTGLHRSGRTTRSDRFRGPRGSPQGSSAPGPLPSAMEAEGTRGLERPA